MGAHDAASPGTPGSKDRLCALIVTYNCGGRVEATFRSVLPQVGRMILVDNGSEDDTPGFLETLRDAHPAEVEILRIETNAGIAGALNRGMKRALAAGYEWVLTMDHDSVADEGMVARLFDAWEATPDPDAVLLVAPVFVDRASRRPGELYRYEGWRRTRLTGLIPSHDLLEPTVVITSGNLVATRAYEKAGGFDERLFIDFVDHDFCLRGWAAGLTVVCATKARLAHAVGSPVTRVFCGRTFSSTNHAPGRRYFQSRNLVEMVRRYGTRWPGYALDIVAAFARDVLGIVLLERGRWPKIRAIARGALDSGRHFGRR